jgi:hypothetical protein
MKPDPAQGGLLLSACYADNHFFCRRVTELA